MDNTVKNDKKISCLDFPPATHCIIMRRGGGEGSQRFFCTYGQSTFVLYTTWKLAKKLLRKIYEQSGY